MRSLRFTLRFIAIVQFFFGILFTFAPATAGGLLGLEPAAPGLGRLAVRDDGGPVPRLRGRDARGRARPADPTSRGSTR